MISGRRREEYDRFNSMMNRSPVLSYGVLIEDRKLNLAVLIVKVFIQVSCFRVSYAYIYIQEWGLR